MSKQSPKIPYLVMYQGPQPQQTFSLKKNLLTLGRDADNDIVINDAEISRYHARLTWQGDKWVIEDLGSSNGTFINGQRIGRPTILAAGSQLQLGPDVVFGMQVGAPGAVRPARRAARKKSAKLPLILAGSSLLGLLALVLIAALAYFAWFAPSGAPPALSWLFGGGDPYTPIPGPDVAFQQPAPDTQIAVGESFDVFVIASDGLGVVRLDLWVDDTLVLSQSSPLEEGITPLILNYGMVGAEAGSYSMVARAYNSLGALGESMAVQVTVSETQVNQPEDQQVIYIAQQGDTVQSVAAATNQSASQIQNMNPGINNNLNPGQPVVVHAPPQLGGQGPAQMGALPNPAAPPPQVPRMGVLPNPIPPGAVIGQLLPPGSLVQNQGGIQDGQSAQMIPSLFPEFKPPELKNLPADIKAPESLGIKQTDCKVTLTWVDKSNGETGYAIYRRPKPGQPSAQLVKILPPNTTSYVDQVPVPGEYEYAVEAMGEEIKDIISGQVAIDVLSADQLAAAGIQQNMLITSRSAPISYFIQPSAACMPDPDGFKYIYFQPLEVNVTDPDIIKLGLWYSINDSPARRIPANEGSYRIPGAWSSDKEVLPLPAALVLNPDQQLIVKIWAIGESLDAFYNNDPRPDLGNIFVSHKLADLLRHKSAYQGKNDQFSVKYNIWIDDIKWTGKGTTSTIPAPTNLRHVNITDTSRVIAWEWNGNSKDIDGFILYRSYSCPGRESEIRAPQMITASKKEREILFINEPVGCAYRYQVSAYSRAGESAPSNALDGYSQRRAVYASINFKSLTINAIPGGGTAQAQIELYVNHYYFRSDRLAVKPSTLNLEQVSQFGKNVHSISYAGFGVNESLTLGFSVSGIDKDGFRMPGSICQGEYYFPPISRIDLISETLHAKSGDCDLTVSIKSYTEVMSAEISQKFTAVGRPVADIAITEIGRIGNSLYGKIENNGPDVLSNHRIYIRTRWAHPNYPDMDDYEPGVTQVIWVQDSLPMWVYLGKTIKDKDFVNFYGIWVEVSPSAKWGGVSASDEELYSFSDPNPANNKKHFTEAEDTPIMK